MDGQQKGDRKGYNNVVLGNNKIFFFTLLIVTIFITTLLNSINFNVR